MHSCPTDDVLERYAKHPEPGGDVARHAEDCPTCRERLSRARDDEELLADLREAWPEPGQETEPDPAPDAGTLRSGLSRYRIIGKLGEGGMGVVYEAEQRSPKRRVALKVLKPAVASAATLARFELEAEVLARLDHPGIARILEADTFDGGHGAQPFLAMELVEGRPLLQFAGEQGLDLDARLDLFVRVCDAVQHAHQKGVVHRDLKPANVLVTADGQPKVVDFGIARASDAETAATAARTHAGQIMGTLPYMSPEQVSGDPESVDTRTDVYALGVMLFELLSGRHPHDLKGLPLAEAVRVIAEREPRRLGSLDPRLRGDLETIAGKALDKERDRRYASAAALADDVRRHRDHEPITARPPSAVYQLRKFARRNRALAASLVALLVVLVGGSVATTTQMLRALDARDAAQDARDRAQKAEVAMRAERDRARRAEAEARQEYEEACKARVLFQEVLVQASPRDATSREPTVRDVLAEAERRVMEDLDDEPRIAAALLHTLGRVYSDLGDAEKAEDYLGRSLALYEEVLGAESFKAMYVLNSMTQLAQARGRFAEAERLGRRALALEHTLREGRDDDRVLLATALNNLANAAYSLGRPDEALELLERATAEYRAAAGEDSVDVGVCLSNRGLVLAGLGRLEEAEDCLEKALPIKRRVVGGRSPRVADTLRHLASVVGRQGRHGEEGRLLAEALEILRERFGQDHEDVATCLFDVGVNLWRQDRLEEGLRRCLEAVDVERRRLGDDHPRVVRDLRRLARMERAAGRHEDAELHLRAAVAGGAARLGDGHFLTLQALIDLGCLLETEERHAEAVPFLERVVAHAGSGGVVAPRRFVAARLALARSLSALGRHADAEGHLLALRRFLEETAGPDHADTKQLLGVLAGVYESWGRAEEAARVRALLR